MKKTLSIMMAFAMGAALLSGCSGPSSSETTSAGTTAAETTAAAGTIATVPETTTAAETTAAPETTTAAEVGLEAPGQSEPVTLRIGSLKGPTSMGLVSLMDKAEKGEAEGSYEFTMVSDASELVAKVVGKDLDIVLVPANMSSILYQRTSQSVNVLNINTLGVLYVVAADDSIQSIPDLAGKTVYMTGKGTTPDYVFQHLLAVNGMSADDLTIEYKSEPTEVAAVLKEQADAIGLLPQPFVTVAMAQNENLKIVLDLTAEWDKAQEGQEGGGSLVTGVTVVRSELLEDEAGAAAVKLFMDEHAASTGFANDDVAGAAELVAQFGIIEKAPVAQKALPYCSIVCIEGDQMKEMLSGYLNVLYEMDPTSVGGQLPDDAFYFAR